MYLRAVLGVVMLGAAACGASEGGGAHTASTSTLRAPLFLDGVPIGEVSGELDVYVAPDRRFVRLAARTPAAVIRLDKAVALPQGDRHGFAHTVARGPIDLGGDLTPARVDVCFGHAILPLALRGIEDDTLLLTKLPVRREVVVQHKSFSIDAVELCLANGDVAAPFASFVSHWTAPDGTKVIVETPANDTARTVLRSDPVKPESAILALLLAP